MFLNVANNHNYSSIRNFFPYSSLPFLIVLNINFLAKNGQCLKWGLKNKNTPKL